MELYNGLDNLEKGMRNNVKQDYSNLISNIEGIQRSLLDVIKNHAEKVEKSIELEVYKLKRNFKADSEKILSEIQAQPKEVDIRKSKSTALGVNVNGDEVDVPSSEGKQGLVDRSVERLVHAAKRTPKKSQLKEAIDSAYSTLEKTSLERNDLNTSVRNNSTAQIQQQVAEKLSSLLELADSQKGRIFQRKELQNSIIEEKDTVVPVTKKLEKEVFDSTNFIKSLLDKSPYKQNHLNIGSAPNTPKRSEIRWERLLGDETTTRYTSNLLDCLIPNKKEKSDTIIDISNEETIKEKAADHLTELEHLVVKDCRVCELLKSHKSSLEQHILINHRNGQFKDITSHLSGNKINGNAQEKEIFQVSNMQDEARRLLNQVHNMAIKKPEVNGEDVNKPRALGASKIRNVKPLIRDNFLQNKNSLTMANNRSTKRSTSMASDLRSFRKEGNTHAIEMTNDSSSKQVSHDKRCLSLSMEKENERESAIGSDSAIKHTSGSSVDSVLITPKLSSTPSIPSPAKKLKSDEWKGPKCGSWKGWALVEEDEDEPKEKTKETTEENVKRSTRGRAIKPTKKSNDIYSS